MARLAQAGLATRAGMTYRFSGFLRSDDPGVRARATLRTRLPDGDWMVLASAELPAPGPDWSLHATDLRATGTTDRAVFELAATGPGSLFADKLSLMPEDSVGGWRSDVVDAVAAAHPAVIRWGGLAVDPGGYRWKEGVGDRRLRAPFPNTAWGRIDSNDVGIDEFCAFCEAVGAEPLICVSYADGPQSAGELVQYCNAGPDNEWGRRRAANGHPRPYGVTYWQLGNEVEAGPQYLAAAEGFCQAIKAADPAALVMSYRPTQELLDRIGRHLGYVCPHHYDIGNLAACDEEITRIAGMLRRTPGCQDVRIGITEWNVAGGDWGFERGRLATLGAALKNARYLNLLLRRSDLVGMACRSNLANSHCTGLLMTNAAGMLKPPAYHVMKLYADHAKPIPRGIEDAPEGVDIMGCASEDECSVCLFAVNGNDHPVEIMLEGAGGEAGVRGSAGLVLAGGESVCDTRDLRQPDLMNHWAARDRVTTVSLAVIGDRISLPAVSISAVECRGPTPPRGGGSSGSAS